MLQRKQSLFLLIAGLAFLFTIVTKIGTITSTPTEEKPYTEEVSFFTYETQYKEISPVERVLIVPNKPIAFLTLYLGLVSLIAIFLFKNRPLQIKLTRVNLILGIALVLMLFIYLFRIQNGTMRGEASFPKFQLGIFTAILGVVCNFFANKFINADEALIKSVDRIR